MDRMKCIIIEDEVPAAEELKYIISGNERVEVVGMAYDGGSGYDLVKRLKPDVVFLDINMPVQNGMELAVRIKDLNKNIAVVFVTAYEQYAIKAFEIEAVDYILKPYEEKRINTTLNRLIENLKDGRTANDQISIGIREIINRLDREKGLVRKIPCEQNGKIILINSKDIYFCYIENEATYVKTRDKKYFTSYTLTELEEKTGFFRSHRSYLVNINNIAELYPWFNGAYELVINDVEKSKVPLSRNHVKKLKELLGMRI